MRRLLAIGVVGVVLVAAAARAATAPAPAKRPTAIGRGGAAASVDPVATAAAIGILRRGGNAFDAAVAAAATLGVVEPYSCGIGGGGFMLVYQARTNRVYALDSRETAPRAFGPTSFIDPATGKPYPFAEQVESGIGVGVPGTLRLWQYVLGRFGTRKLAQVLRPAEAAAKRGFVVDATFHDQTDQNKTRFRDFTTSSALFLRGGEAPPVGSTLRNPQLARTYELIGRRGVDVFYKGAIGRAIVATVQRPPLASGATHTVRAGSMTLPDLRRYAIKVRTPVRTAYRRYTVYGMPPPSSGGSTAAETLNILEGFDLAHMDRVQALHRYLEATRLAYADRNAYLADPKYVNVPLAGLVSKRFAAERRAKIGGTAATSPVAAGDPRKYQSAVYISSDREGPSTTHLTVSDRFGNIVVYTFTIEQTGGSAMAVPGYGFLLNNELTDFDPMPGRPNSPAAGKRPRSSIAPTLVFVGRRPLLALGSPGGATIITTVLQTLVNRLDFGMSLPQAIASPRASQRNATGTDVEAAFASAPEAAGLRALGHRLNTPAEIGAETGIEFLGRARLEAVAEPIRRGGGSAMVVRSR